SRRPSRTPGPILANGLFGSWRPPGWWTRMSGGAGLGRGSETVRRGGHSLPRIGRANSRPCPLPAPGSPPRPSAAHPRGSPPSRSWALLEQGDLDGAVAAARERIRLRPEDGAGYWPLHGALLGKQDIDGALAAIREATRLAPNSPTFETNLGLRLLDVGDWDGA